MPFSITKDTTISSTAFSTSPTIHFWKRSLKCTGLDPGRLGKNPTTNLSYFQCFNLLGKHPIRLHAVSCTGSAMHTSLAAKQSCNSTTPTSSRFAPADVNTLSATNRSRLSTTFDSTIVYRGGTFVETTGELSATGCEITDTIVFTVQIRQGTNSETIPDGERFFDQVRTSTLCVVDKGHTVTAGEDPCQWLQRDRLVSLRSWQCN